MLAFSGFVHTARWLRPGFQVLGFMRFLVCTPCPWEPCLRVTLLCVLADTLNCQTSCCCLVAESCLSFVTPWTAARQGSVSFTIPWSLLRFISIELVMLSNHLILCCPLFLLPSVFPSIRVFFSESAFGIRWPKYWSFSFSISPSNEYSGLISFRIDWFDLLTNQGTLKSLLQHHDSKTSVWCSAFIVQLSNPLHDYWKNHSFDFLVGIEEYLMAAFVCVSLLASKVKHLFTPFSAILSFLFCELIACFIFCPLFSILSYWFSINL